MKPLDLATVGLPVFPCSDDKRPAIKGGFHSATLDPNSQYYPSAYIGLPIPAGVVILDLDTHKGITSGKIDSVLGCRLNWDGSLLQHTPSGGSHHAFLCDELVRQGSDLFHKEIGLGFDTRTTGSGYICTGTPYAQGGPAGVMAISPMLMGGLPQLPAEAIEKLKVQIESVPVPKPLPVGDKDADEIRRMLRCIDADGPRDEWIQCAMALKHHYHDNDATGFTLFDNWSQTGATKYNPAECRHQWNSLKPAPAGKQPVTLGTLVKHAMTGGYIPTNAAANLFGQTDQVAAPMPVLESLIGRINSEGGKPEVIDQLTAEIRALPCSDIQRAALTAALSRSLKDHGLKITERELKDATSPNAPATVLIPQPVAPLQKFSELTVQPIPALGNIHRENAEIFRSALFKDRLQSFRDADVYWWSGACWERVEKMLLTSKIADAFSGSEFGKTPNINSTDAQVRNLSYSTQSLNPISQKIYFQNGVLDPATPNAQLQPHQPSNCNSFTLSVDYDPTATAPEWQKFLADICSAEPERALLIQEVMGWALISDNLNQQKAIAFNGPPRSGKGTILDTIANILGDGLCDVSIGQLANDKALGQMRNAQVSADRDAKKPNKNDFAAVHSRFNTITANEPVSIPILYSQDPWHGRLNCKIMIASNGIPIIMDDSGAAPNRWIIVRFDKSFLGREDLTLGARLRTETTGIAAWAVQGLQRLMLTGKFTTLQSSLDELQDTIENSSPYSQFIDERLEMHPDGAVTTHELWASWQAWAALNGSHKGSHSSVTQGIKKAMHNEGVIYKRIRIKNTQQRCFLGMRLKLGEVHSAPSNVTPFEKKPLTVPQTV